ncbi:MAG TPA: M23 family metallopeptidase [Oculatellaceae cyanobacterium]
MILAPGKAFATVEPEVSEIQPSVIEETREILARASLIALQGLSALQQLQTLSTDSTTTEMLKNYMASMIYIPKPAKLPSDMEALDEPWVTEENPDGMFVPHVDDFSTSEKGIDLNPPGKKVLKLLQPVQNALISSGFGLRWGRPHQGIDMAAPLGTAIVAAEAGKVVYSGWKSGYGNFVAVDHGHGYRTHYAHCSKLLVNVGQTVQKGQLIARVGNTGNSTGPHLHFEVVANGTPLNPIKFLNQPLTVVGASNPQSLH